jgi:hypothetical protein
LKQQALLDSTHVDTLIERYKCEAPTCSNNGGFCYVADGKTHLRIFIIQLKAWSIAINEGDATIECPTEAFLKALMPAKQGTRNPYKMTDIARPISTNSKTSSLEPVTPTPPPYPAYPMPPMPSYPYHPLFHPYSSFPLHYSSPDSRRTSQKQNQTHELRSSPSMEQDPIERMIKYFNWLARVSPRQAKEINEARESLVAKGYSFRTLPQISDAAFVAMEINDGLLLLIKSEIDVFKREEDKGRV